MQNFFGENMPLLPWMINYNCPNAVECLQTKNARGPTNTLDFLASLDLNAPIGRRALTKIACCVGPNSSTPELIEQLLSEGITTLVISTSQTDEQELQTFIRNVRKTILTFSSYCGRVYPVGIIVQLGATHLKTGFLKNNEKDEVLLNENEHICLTANEDYKCDCTKKIIYINFKDIMAVLKSDDMVYIDFGKIILQVIHLNLKYKTIKCKIVVGGMLRNEAWVYIKSIPLEYEETDTKMIEFSLKNEVDGIIVPRVQSAQDVIKIRDLIVQKDPSVMLFANIETVTGVQNIDEILEVCEGVIMSRHILNMMYPTEKMNIVQKVIIAKCNRAGKPIFVRISQFSCNTNLFVLKFEESIDMSNLILDGVDGFVLQQQVANSENLETSLKLLQRLSLESEAVIFQKQVLSNFISHVTNYKFNGDCIPIIFSHRPKLNKGELFSNCIYDRWEKVVWRFSALYDNIDLFNTFAISAVDLCVKSKAVCCIVITVSGRAARIISQYRVPCPLLAVTKYGHACRKLNMWRSVTPIHFVAHSYDNWDKDINMRYDYAVTYGKYFGLIQGGDPMVLVNSGKEGQGFNNTLRVIYASANNCNLKLYLNNKLSV